MISSNDLMEIGDMVHTKAEELFKQLGVQDDFCIQYIGGAVVVFGGLNRITWHPWSGFSLDTAYCTPETIRKWNALQIRGTQ